MDKKLRDISAAIAALNGAHIATIDRVKVGTPVYTNWERLTLAPHVDIKPEWIKK
jgi:hypothetical protein